MSKHKRKAAFLAAEFDASIKARQPSARTKVEWVLVSALRSAARSPRTHSKRQIEQIAASIRQFGFINPIITDDNWKVLAGKARLDASKILGLREVPVVRISYLSETEIRAYMLADNKLAEKAGWDRQVLAFELGELAVLLPQIHLDLSITGFEPGEADTLALDFGGDLPDPADEIPEPSKGPVISRAGDLWVLGSHKLFVGDARDPESYRHLLRAEVAAMVFCDPPFNVSVAGHVGGRGRIKHREFAFASGEMSSNEFIDFLEQTLGLCVQHAADGSIHYITMDWRHAPELHAAGSVVYTELKNICVWIKSNAGQGSFYRSQHEFVFVFKSGTAPHLNSFGLGQHGRTRSNVWRYQGVNSFRAGRMDELKMHPTCKPILMVVDAMRDCSRRGDIVLDAFAGSGTTIMAAEQVGRRAYCIEIDAQYADVCIRRWQAYTKRDAVLERTGQTFNELAAADAFKSPDKPARPRTVERADARDARRPSPLAHGKASGKRAAPSARSAVKSVAKPKPAGSAKRRTSK